jgi:hypothetical protein
LYVSIKDKKGKWTDPVFMGVSLNSQYSEITPFLTPRKDRLYFSSNREDSRGGYDIYYSDRLYDSWILWTIPKRIPGTINSPHNEKFFQLYNGHAYFINDKTGNYDIYKSKKRDYNPLDHLFEY